MDDPRPSPEFGPGGYLPERASKRARKIVLRAPLGLQWIVGSAVFGLVLLAAGLLWLNTAGAPGEPWVATVPIDEGAAPTVTRAEAVDAWVVTGTGPVLAVPGDAVADLAWCGPANQLESADGRVWSATGRGLGTASLPTHPVTVHDGMVYVDPTRVAEGPRPTDDEATAGC